MLSSGGMLVNK